MKKNDKTISKRLFFLIKRNIETLVAPGFFKNYSKWKKLKGKYKGKRVFLIGNGPSLNKTPLYLLKDEYTICFNRFSLMQERLNWIPSFYMVMDSVVAVDIKDEMRSMAQSASYGFFPDISTDFVNFRKIIGDLKKVCYFHPEPVKFSNHLPWINNGNTVVFPAFQILKYLGFSEIYFCGVDVNYAVDKTCKVVDSYGLKGKTFQVIESNEDDDANHFDPRYFGKGRTYHQPDSNVVSRIFDNMNTVYEYTKDSDVRVLNVGYDSKVDVFEKEDFLHALGYSAGDIEHIFESLVMSLGFKGLEDFRLSVNSCDSMDDWDDSRKVNSLPTDIAVLNVPKKIFDTIPIGPYEGRVYFVSRN